MNEKAGQFRSAAFGGFHRQDVLDYLEQLTKEKQALEDRLTEEEAARTRAESSLAQAQEELALLRQSQDAMNAELEYLRSELEARSDSLAQTEAERKALRVEVEALRPGAESWEHIKEQAGSIELSAHERAQITIQDARVQAAQIQTESTRWVRDILDRCDSLQSDMKSSIRAAEDQLDFARACFRQAERDMEGYQLALSDLVESAQETDPPGETEE